MDQDIHNRLINIVREVKTLCGVNSIADVFSDHREESYPKLDARLQEILASSDQFKTVELLTYLRSSFSYKNSLPTWNAVLEAAVSQSRALGEDVDAIYIGLIPR